MITGTGGAPEKANESFGMVYIGHPGGRVKPPIVARHPRKPRRGSSGPFERRPICPDVGGGGPRGPGDRQLLEIVELSQHQSLEESVALLMGTVERWGHDGSLKDDVSILALEIAEE